MNDVLLSTSGRLIEASKFCYLLPRGAWEKFMTSQGALILLEDDVRLSQI